MSAKHEPTAEKRASVQSLAQFGIPQAQIAAHIGISEPTLRAHYRAELDAGALAANLKVATNLFNFAAGQKGGMKEQVTAGIFWAKTRMGWKETQDVNHNVNFTAGARERLAGKLGVSLASSGEESAPDIAPPIGSA